MGVFDDKRYEALDWVSKAVEPVECGLAKILEEFPEHIEFNYDMLAKHMMNHNNVWRLYAREAIRQFISTTLHSRELALLENCIEFQGSSALQLDFEAGTMTGTLALVKTRSAFTEEELQSMIGKQGIEECYQLSYGDYDIARLNEIADLLGATDALSSRSYRKKVSSVTGRLTEIMQKNEWNIRNVELSDKVGRWIYRYVIYGDLSALTNICKLKVMTHKNLPIYSMAEEV
jgi:hypothetical protein